MITAWSRRGHGVVTALSLRGHCVVTARSRLDHCMATVRSRRATPRRLRRVTSGRRPIRSSLIPTSNVRILGRATVSLGKSACWRHGRVAIMESQVTITVSWQGREVGGGLLAARDGGRVGGAVRACWEACRTRRRG